MKFTALTVFLALCLAAGVDAVVKQLTLNGSAHIQFFGPRDEIWNGISNDNRYPIINSGDTIALRSAYPSGNYLRYWLTCTTSICYYNNGPDTVMTTSKWSGFSSFSKFKITAKGKMDGQPINSGDTVSLSSERYGARYLLRCWVSTSYICRVQSVKSPMTGNDWMTYNWATFQIYAKYATDGTPIQYRDVVGFKYPFGGYNSWLYFTSSRFYARGCSYNNKASCATENTATGFRIFKRL